LMNQQRMEISAQYHQQQLELNKQKAEEAKKLNDQKIQQAMNQMAAKQKVDDFVQKGMAQNPQADPQQLMLQALSMYGADMQGSLPSGLTGALQKSVQQQQTQAAMPEIQDVNGQKFFRGAPTQPWQLVPQEKTTTTPAQKEESASLKSARDRVKEAYSEYVKSSGSQRKANKEVLDEAEAHVNKLRAAEGFPPEYDLEAAKPAGEGESKVNVLRKYPTGTAPSGEGTSPAAPAAPAAQFGMGPGFGGNATLPPAASRATAPAQATKSTPATPPVPRKAAAPPEAKPLWDSPTKVIMLYRHGRISKSEAQSIIKKNWPDNKLDIKGPEWDTSLVSHQGGTRWTLGMQPGAQGALTHQTTSEGSPYE